MGIATRVWPDAAEQLPEAAYPPVTPDAAASSGTGAENAQRGGGTGRSTHKLTSDITAETEGNDIRRRTRTWFLEREEARGRIEASHFFGGTLSQPSAPRHVWCLGIDCFLVFFEAGSASYLQGLINSSSVKSPSQPGER